MKKILLGITAGLIVMFAASSVISTIPAAAQVSSGLNAAKTEELENRSVDSLVGTIVNVMLWVVGILSVVMIVWSGFKFITSNGDSGKIQSARTTLIYALVGLVVAVMAYAIAEFVKNQTQSSK